MDMLEKNSEANLYLLISIASFLSASSENSQQLYSTYYIPRTILNSLLTQSTLPAQDNTRRQIL